MSSLGLTSAPDDLYHRLARRNRIVATLRWGVPLAGLVVLAVLAVQIALDAFLNQLGFANIRIDRDNLVVESPELSATEADGTRFSVKASEARTALGGSDRIDLTDMVFTLNRPNGGELVATSATAELQTSGQLVTIPGTTSVTSTDGISGTLEGVFADFPNETLVAGGAVALDFESGARLEADSMYYDGAASTWSFSNVTLTIDSTPGASP